MCTLSSRKLLKWWKLRRWISCVNLVNCVNILPDFPLNLYCLGNILFRFLWNIFRNWEYIWGCDAFYQIGYNSVFANLIYVLVICNILRTCPPFNSLKNRVRKLFYLLFLIYSGCKFFAGNLTVNFVNLSTRQAHIERHKTNAIN